jgi:hypothetical protein
MGKTISSHEKIRIALVRQRLEGEKRQQARLVALYQQRYQEAQQKSDVAAADSELWQLENARRKLAETEQALQKLAATEETGAR